MAPLRLLGGLTALCLVSVLLVERQGSPVVLDTAPGYWESPNPWVVDPNDYANTFMGVSFGRDSRFFASLYIHLGRIASRFSLYPSV
jgi:hypothetical protein